MDQPPTKTKKIDQKVAENVELAFARIPGLPDGIFACRKHF
jgi:hypothetical protein